MKLNKRIASGALALALVTPVVANAAEGTYVTTTLPKAVTEKVVVDGQTYTKAQFQEALKQANKDYNEYLAAKAEADNLEESLKVAKDRYNKAYEAYKAEDLKTEDGKKVVKEKQTNLDIAVDKLNSMIVNAVKSDEVIAYLDKGYGPVTEGSNINGSKLAKDSNAKVQTGEFEEAIDRVNKAYAELKEAEKNADKPATDSEKYREYTAASYEKDRLQDAYDAAKAKADKAKNDSNTSFGALNAIAQAYNVMVEATNNGIAVVDKDQKPAEKEIDYAKLEASVARAKETLRAVEILKDLTPNTAANNQAKLDALVVEQKAKVAKAEAILKAAGKEVALFSTAYAAEEEVTAEDVDALIKELDDNTAAIQKELKEIDKDVEVEEETPAEDDKEEDEKPADKEEDKADDKKEDKAEDKKDDKKEDDTKVIEKTKVVEKSANKTAGSNAKTGIAGVAGVAGVLAAASVAYAASKKNN